MQITSLFFILISVISVFVFYLLKAKYRVLFLSVLSGAFIATYSYNLLVYVIIYSLINYAIGYKIPNSRFSKFLFLTGIILNLFQLILLKYVSFTVSPLFELLNIEWDLQKISRIIIPVGVSFFTLQGIGYLVNIKMGWEKPEKNFLHFLLYITFFPRLLSGPIDRSNHFLPQLKLAQSFDEQRVIKGLKLVLIGLFKKVAIANQLAPIVIGTYANLNSSDKYSLWIVMLLQPLYLYFDFSGYTDIAFGIARSFGIELRPNFNRPFLAENMTNFWKRFHISLSSWFQDYVFMRVVFKYRKWGRNASTLALFVTWLLFGIWHGAGWTFMLLGLLQGIAVYYEFTTKKWRIKFFSRMPELPRKWIGRVSTYLFYGASLVFFFAPDLNSVSIFYTKLFQTDGLIPGGIRQEVFIMVMIFVIIFMVFEILKNDFSNFYSRIEAFWIRNSMKNRIFRWALYFCLITILLILNKEVQEFIYFQF